MATIRLNQALARNKEAHSLGEGDLTNAYHTINKSGPMSGLSRTYQPRNDGDEVLPPESVLLQLRVEDLLDTVARTTAAQINATATVDQGNTVATGDIKVGDEVIATDVPVTTLLFLEKKLTNLLDLLAKAPTLPADDTWSRDEATGAYATAPVQTVRTKKIPRNHVKAEATDKHPAQVDVWYEDVTVGYWNTVKYSGALPALRKRALIDRVRALRDGVKMAREEANTTVIDEQDLGSRLFGWLGRLA